MRLTRFLLVAGLLATWHTAVRSETPNWQSYGPAVFEQAADEQRLILLDLVAVWCHWCHVMDETTYQDAAVLTALDEHYIAVKADHDARPDLAERYRDHGWPATIILTPSGDELAIRSGYISPDAMVTLLRNVAGRSMPAPVADDAITYSQEAQLSPALYETLQQRHLRAYDADEGGLALMQKFLDADTVEWDLHLAASGDSAAEARARHYLDAALALIDPAFGGAYQYSTHGDWQHAHYEKIMSTQAAYLRAYSLGYRYFADPRYRTAGQQIAAWLDDFMRAPDGGFYSSQDADLERGRKAHDYFALDREQRLQRGLPRIDKNRYADVNGRAIEGLVTLYRVTGEKRYLAQAVSALDWTMRNRMLEDGGFAHGANDAAGPYLSDTLYMGRALLAIHEVSGQQVWLQQAAKAGKFIARHFPDARGGLSSAVDNGTPLRPVAQIDQNIHAARFLYALASVTDDMQHASTGDQAMRYLVTPAVASSRLSDPGILLAGQERSLLMQQLGRLSLLPARVAGEKS